MWLTGSSYMNWKEGIQGCVLLPAFRVPWLCTRSMPTGLTNKKPNGSRSWVQEPKLAVLDLLSQILALTQEAWSPAVKKMAMTGLSMEIKCGSPMVLWQMLQWSGQKMRKVLYMAFSLKKVWKDTLLVTSMGS